MKKLLLLSLILLVCSNFKASAQKLVRSSINSFGSVVINDNLKLSQSAGQSSATQSINENEINLRQGFQQPITTLYSNSNSLNINIYPNPTQNNINITFDNNRDHNFSYYLFDSQGRICQFETDSESNNIELKSNLKPGIYTIRVVAERKIGVASIIIIP